LAGAVIKAALGVWWYLAEARQQLAESPAIEIAPLRVMSPAPASELALEESR
jgi:hypothetical protein